ncbi:hypothetical protein [Streptomyces noursei]|uniref:hypothetical protein n=1 Tax=Streptomyces noursei TaxID=1971 RepID=UPI0030F1176D
MPAETKAVSSPPADAVARDAHWSKKMARLRARQLPEHTLVICDDQETKARVDAAALELSRCRMVDAEASREPSEETRRAEQELQDAQGHFASVAVELTFRALPRPVLDGLIKRFPPSEAQAEDGDAWDPERFPAALIAAAHVERDERDNSVEGMSEEEAQELLDSWPVAESNALFAAAWQAQQIVRTSAAELGKG